MKCEELELYLIDFTEKNIPAEKNVLIKEHIKKCKKCKNLFEEFSGLWEIVNLPVEEELSPYFRAKLKSRIKDYEKPVFSKTTSPLVKYLKPVVVGLLFIFGIFLGIELGKYPMVEERFTITQEQQENPFQIDYLSLFDDIPEGTFGYNYLNLQNED